MTIKFKKLYADAKIPTKAYPTDSGWDLYAYESLILHAGERYTISTGIAMAIDPGLEGQVRARSGLASKKGLSVVNSPGTIDSSYRGEVKAVLLNTDPRNEIHIIKGDRIAQLVVCPVCLDTSEEVMELPPADRGTNGFGSSGS